MSERKQQVVLGFHSESDQAHVIFGSLNALFWTIFCFLHIYNDLSDSLRFLDARFILQMLSSSMLLSTALRETLLQDLTVPYEYEQVFQPFQGCCCKDHHRQKIEG